MDIKLTAARIIIIRELSTGPKKWGQLQKAYYGLSRAGEKVNTSFHNKLQDCIKLRIIKHDRIQHSYELDEVGKQMLDYMRAHNVDMNVKSEAQLKYEAGETFANRKPEQQA